MNGLFSERGFPHKGWSWLGCDDLEEYPSSHQCPACAREWPRYVHTITHPRYGTLQVGCVCAEKLTEDYVNPRAREKELKSRTSRREHFPDRAGWQATRKGNQRLRIDGLVVVVSRQRNGRFGVAFAPELSDRWWSSPHTFANERDAQLAAFDLLEKRKQHPPRPTLAPNEMLVDPQAEAIDDADVLVDPWTDAFDDHDVLTDEDVGVQANRLAPSETSSGSFRPMVLRGGVGDRRYSPRIRLFRHATTCGKPPIDRYMSAPDIYR